MAEPHADHQVEPPGRPNGPPGAPDRDAMKPPALVSASVAPKAAAGRVECRRCGAEMLTYVGRVVIGGDCSACGSYDLIRTATTPGRSSAASEVPGTSSICRCKGNGAGSVDRSSDGS